MSIVKKVINLHPFYYREGSETRKTPKSGFMSNGTNSTNITAQSTSF